MQIKVPFQVSIPRRLSHCAKGNEAFTPGMEYYSVLAESDQDQVYIRQDFCPSCWNQIENEIGKVLSHWKATTPHKKATSDLPLKRDARALYLLKEALANGNDLDMHAEAFVLALYLARRRRLYARQEVTLKSGVPATIYEVAENEEMLCVPRLKLSDLQVDKVQSELAVKFKGAE